MKIEIVEFYPITREFKRVGNHMGYFHIYLCDYDIDLKNVVLKKKRGSHIIGLPFASSLPHDSDKRVMFSVFKFCNPKKNDALIEAVQEQVETFLVEWFNTNKCDKRVKKRIGYS